MGTFFVLVALFCFNTMLHPTSFDLGSQYADKWGKNCQGTVLGIQNSFFSVGNAVGPLVATALLSVEYCLVFVFMFSGLVLVLVLNGGVWVRYKTEILSAVAPTASQVEANGEEEKPKDGKKRERQGEKEREAEDA